MITVGNTFDESRGEEEHNKGAQNFAEEAIACQSIHHCYAKFWSPTLTLSPH